MAPLIFPWREEGSTPRIKGISEHSTSHRKLKMCFMHSLYPLFVLQGGFKVESNCFKPYELTEKTWPLKMTFNFPLSHICVSRKNYIHEVRRLLCTHFLIQQKICLVFYHHQSHHVTKNLLRHRFNLIFLHRYGATKPEIFIAWITALGAAAADAAPGGPTPLPSSPTTLVMPLWLLPLTTPTS